MATGNQINPQSRVRSHFRRWARRWGTVCADSFNRINADDLGTADTGHDWLMLNPSAVVDPWAIRGGKARLRVNPGASYVIPLVASGLADARVRVQVTIGTITFPGVGLALRWDPNTSEGVLLHYHTAGGTQYRCSTYSGGLLTTQFNLTGPVLAAGETHLFEARMAGSTIELFVASASIGSGTLATHATNTRHGIFCWREPTNEFDNFRIVRV
jgi:hypothetical protein